MKTINIPFEDDEVEKLEKIKGSSTWKSFIMSLVDEKELVERIKKIAIGSSYSSERSKAIQILASKGKIASLALADIAEKGSYSSEREAALEALGKIKEEIKKV